MYQHRARTLRRPTAHPLVRPLRRQPFIMVVQRLVPFLILALALVVQDASALTFYVNGDPAIGDDRRSVVSAQNSETPFRTITQALKVAHVIPEGRPHIIDIASGTYRHGVNGEQLPLVITEPDIFIKPGGGQVKFDGDSAHKFFELSNLGDEFLIKGFDFRNGFADRGSIASCEACSLRVTDNTFRSNRASQSAHLFYVKDGRLRFFNNKVTENGTFAGEDVPLIEIDNEFDDTSDPDQRDFIRNNTFHDNNGPTVLSSGNGLDLNSNIFIEGVEPIVIDQSATVDPVIRHNIFWDTDILFVDDELDSINVARTVRDTTVQEQPVVPPIELVYTIPDFVLSEPDTLIIFSEGVTPEVHDFFIDVGDFRDFWEFKALSLPAGIDASIVDSEGRVTWAPTIADTGHYQIEIEIKDPSKIDNLMSYPLNIATVWPPLPLPPIPPVVEISFVADTTGALTRLNALTPAFGTAASAGSNLYVDPLLINPEAPFRNFIPLGGSPAIHGGDPTVLYDDSNTTTNDVGYLGGPTNAGNPTAGVFTEIDITSLPDTVVKAGETYTYALVVNPAATIQRVDILQGPPTMAAAFGKPPPINWVPTDADAGLFLVGTIVTVSNAEGRQYFNLRVKLSNELPVILSDADVEALEDQPYSYTVLATDPDEDALSFNVLSGPDGLAVDASGVVTWTPGQADVGDNQVQIEVVDARDGSTIHLYTLSVINVNDPPAFTGTPLLTATEDVAYSYTAAGTDPDPDDSFTFALIAGPAGLSVDAQGLVQWTPLQANVGTNAVELQIADVDGLTATQSFAIDVAEVDDPPTISSQPIVIANEDDEYLYSLLAVDEEGGGVSFSLTQSPPGLTIDSEGTLTWTPVEADVGLHTIEVSVSDSSDLESIQSFELEVIAVNDAPTIDGRIPADALIVATAGSTQPLSVSASDEEGGPLTYSWLVDGLVQAGSLDPTFNHTVGADMAATIEVKVSDGTTSSSSLWVVDGRSISRFSISSEGEVDFGSVDLGGESTITLEIANNGQQALGISNLQLPDLQFTATFGTATIAAGTISTLELRVVPTSRGVQQTLLTFDTTDPDNGQIQVPLTAEAIVPSRLGLDANPDAGNQSAIAVTATAGQQLAIAVYLTEALSLTDYGLSLQFDPASISFDEFQLASPAEVNLIAAAGGSLLTTVSEPSQGVVEIDVDEGSAFAGIDGDGLLGVILVSVAADVTAGSEIELTLVSASLLSADQSEADVLAPQLTVSITVPILKGDFDGDNMVGFEDFFMFADRFGTSDPIYDLNNSGLVDLDDFFILADNFGASVGKTPASERREQADALFVSAHTDQADRVAIEVRSSPSGEVVDAFALDLEYDAQALDFLGYEPRQQGGPQPIVWTPVNDGAGRLAIAVALTGAGEQTSRELGLLQFARLSGEETTLRLHDGLARIGGTTRPVKLPGSLKIGSLPTRFVLYPAHPNPFNPQTTISFFLPEAARVTLRIFDLLGQQVRTLVETDLHAGRHQAVWDAKDETGKAVASGVYLIELGNSSDRQVAKLLLVQ